MICKEGFEKQVKAWQNTDVFAGFERESGKLQGYAVLTDYGSYVEFSILRTEPSAERNAINAAMVNGIFEHYKDRFDGHFYINDGSRAIRHETAFQDYLENDIIRKHFINRSITASVAFALFSLWDDHFRFRIHPAKVLSPLVVTIMHYKQRNFKYYGSVIGLS